MDKTIKVKTKEICKMMGWKLTWFDYLFYTWKLRIRYDTNTQIKIIRHIWVKKGWKIGIVDMNTTTIDYGNGPQKRKYNGKNCDDILAALFDTLYEVAKHNNTMSTI